MTQPPMPAPPAPRPAGPGLAVSLIVGAVGLVVAIVSAVLITIPLLGTFTSTVYPVPGDLHMHLHDARYNVYERTGSGLGGFDRDSSVAPITPADVAVTAPDGSAVPVSYVSASERITRGSAVYTSTLEFDAPTDGDYVLRFTNTESTRVIVVRSIEDAVRSVLVWIGAGALGGALLVLGIILLIVGATRRGRQKRAAYATWAVTGGGWYGPPTAQWGTPGVTQPYPPQYPPGSSPPQYPHSGYPQSPPAGYGYPPPPPSYPSPPPPPAEQPPADDA